MLIPILLASVILAQPSTPPPPADQAGKPVGQPPAATTPATPATPESTIRFGSPKAIPKPEGALRIASYNIENLFDDKDDPALSGENDDAGMTKPETQLKGAAAAIRAINADVIALTEVESKDAVIWFRDKYLADLGYQYVESLDAGDARGIEQAVISRYPLSDPKNWLHLPLGGEHPAKWGNAANHDAGKPIEFHRSPFRVTVTVPGTGASAKPYQVTLFAVHQKSGAPGGYWREKEAAKTVELVGEFQAAHPNANVVILGDFNANPGQKPIQTFTSAGLIDLFAHRKKGDPAYITHESNRTIDFILLNPAAEKELIKETRFILGTPARPAGVDYRTTPGPEGYASDHYPVVMDLTPVDKD